MSWQYKTANNISIKNNLSIPYQTDIKINKTDFHDDVCQICSSTNYSICNVSQKNYKTPFSVRRVYLLTIVGMAHSAQWLINVITSIVCLLNTNILFDLIVGNTNTVCVNSILINTMIKRKTDRYK